MYYTGMSEDCPNAKHTSSEGDLQWSCTADNVSPHSVYIYIYIMWMTF